MNEINSESDNLVYELGYHLLPTADESEIPAQASGIKSLIEENEGVIISEEMPKMVALAYDISKSINTKKQNFSKAYFGWVKFEMDPSKISNIKNKAENLQNILRFLIIKTVKENTMHTPKIPMFKRESISKDEKIAESVDKPKASEAEIDKSIDELVVDQAL